MGNVERSLLKIATEIQAIAQNGLAYCKNPFDRERYQELLNIALELFSPTLSQQHKESIAAEVLSTVGYCCPKIDVRALIYEDNQLLLVQEVQDGHWSLPGGWADVNYSPAVSIIKEVLEETGLHCQVSRLLALWDTAKHDHPPHWPYIYKCVFACTVEQGAFNPSHEVTQVAYFTLDNLPPLSTYRITEKQIRKLIELLHDNTDRTVFD